MMLSKDELQTLNGLLLDQISEECMLLSEFDGFCAGLLVCPELILPTEWLPYVLDGDFSDLQARDDFEHLIDLLMRHYNGVASALAAPKPTYGPLLDEDTRSGEIQWETWGHGFGCAMMLRPDAWERIMESDDAEAEAAVRMMLALVDIAEGRSTMPKVAIDTLTEKAPDLIAQLVLTMNAWTKSQATVAPFSFTSAANQPSAPFKGNKVGRNAPCPCGSGRKYKRCCGGN